MEYDIELTMAFILASFSAVSLMLAANDIRDLKRRVSALEKMLSTHGEIADGESPK